MSGSPRRPVAPRSRRAAPPVLYLVHADTGVERDLIDGWLREYHISDQPHSVVDTADVDGLTRALEAAEGDPELLPLGVTWLQPEGAAPRGPDLLRVVTAIRPIGALQRIALRREPDRARVLGAEPARLSRLRERWQDGGHVDAGSGSFARFVQRQAVLALERAERALAGTRYKVPSEVRTEIARRRSFWAGVAELARAEGRSEDEVGREAFDCLDEMITQQTKFGVDAFGQMESFLLRSYEIEYSKKDLEALRDLNRTRSLVFLPSHRSYMDPMVLSLALQECGFPPNHVLGGINLDFWPMGALARRAGIVFIRRSFRDNEVYKFALRQYLGYLTEKRFNLEWYLEGGRSRTGKLRPPKFGLFNYLADAFREGRADDLALVPVSIVYDQLYEAGEMAREARGGAKPRENLGYLLRYARAQGQGFGAIRISFGEPLSFREALAGPDASALAVEKAAIEVCHRINRVTPITPTSLVTLALLGFGERALTLSQISDVLTPLLDHVERRRLPLTEPLLLRAEGGVLDVLEELIGHRVVRRHGDGLEPLYVIGPDQHLVAAYYRNSAIHFFLTRAITEMAIASVPRGARGDVEARVIDEALRLRDLLKFEFFFARQAEFVDDVRSQVGLLLEGASVRQARTALEAAPLHLAERVLGSFLEAYWVVADRLAARGAGPGVEDATFLGECLAAGRQYLLQKRIHSPESISKELFATGLQLARNRRLTDGGEGVDLARGRAALAAQLTDLISRLAVIHELALRDLDRAAAGRRPGRSR